MTDYGYPLPDLRSQILSFKVAQLQDCAGRLGISKSGKKAEVQNRLLSYFGLNPASGPGDISLAVQGKLESAARIIKDVYCQSRGIIRRPSSSPGPTRPPSANGAATPNAAGTPMNGTNTQLPSTKIKLHYNTDINTNPGKGNASAIGGGGGRVVVRCFCKNTAARSNMIQCSEPSCGVWQHRDCIGTAALNSSNTTTFYCEQCRVHLADPFWRPLEQLLPVSKFRPTVGVPPIRDTYGDLHPQQIGDIAVYLSEQQLSRSKSLPDSERILASCLLLEDPVPCRLHWPRNVTMKVNRYPYRVYGRSTTSKMGINQRDEAATLATLCFAGRNTLEIQAVESGTWLLLLYRAEARTVNQVKEMMLPEESISEAVTRVKKLMHADDAIAIASQIVSLIDPWSGQKMETPARFTDASGLQAFDLDSFLSLAQRNRKWQDPTTLKNSTIRRLQVDKYMKSVLSCLSGGGKGGGGGLEFREIVINDEGKWRPEGSDESSLRWFSIEEDEEIVRKELAAYISNGGGGGGGGLRSPSAANGTNGAASTRNTPGESEGVFLSDTESDEEEELRKAAAAVKTSAAQAALAGRKRKAESEPEPEVICLLSDSDDDNGGGAGAAGANRNNANFRNPLPPIPLQLPPGRATTSSIRLANNTQTSTTAAAGGANKNSNLSGNPIPVFQGHQPPKTGYPYYIQRPPVPAPGQYPGARMNRVMQNGGGGQHQPHPNPHFYNPQAPPGAAGRGGGHTGPSMFFQQPQYQQRPMYNAARPGPSSPLQPRPPPPPPPPAGGEAGRVLSQSAKEALEETLAALRDDPELVDQVNVDDWLS